MFGQKGDKRTGQPKIEFEIRLFRGSERIFQSRMIAVPVDDSGKAKVLAGTVRLPETLPRGDYTMELVAH